MGWLNKLGPKLTVTTETVPDEAEAARKSAEAAAQPKGVTREELDTILASRFDAVLAQISQVAGRPVQVTWPTQQPTTPALPEVSDEEINQALLGAPNAVGTVRKLVQAEALKVANQLVRDHINPLRDTGLGAISNLVAEHAAATLPFYKKFKAEIDARVSGLTADQQVNPLAIKLVHDTVVGERWEDVANEVLEQRARKAAEPTTGSNMPGGASARAGRPSADAVDLEDFGGKAAMRALEFKDGGAQDLDTFAKKLGYKSFAEYAAIMPQLEAQYKQ